MGMDGARIIEGNGIYSILEAASGEKCYCLNAIPNLSWEEQRLLGEVAGLFQKAGKRPDAKGLRLFFREYCFRNFILLEKRQVQYLCEALERHVFGFGPLDYLLSDDCLEEIASIGIGPEKPVFVFHRRHGWLSTNIFFSSPDFVRELANRMARSLGRRLSMGSPVMNAVMPDGSRLSAVISPVSFHGPSLTIRKFSKRPFTPAQLVENRTFSAELMAFLWVAMQCDCSILLVGNTGSGKTSSLNALLSFVPMRERIVVVEETPEIRVLHQHFVKLNVVGEQGIGMHDLIVESLRMRPDRIVVGEIRGIQEVSAFIDTMLAGQGKGSYATFHGQSASEAVGRLRCLGAMEEDIASIDLVVVQRRWNIIGKHGMQAETRRVVEVAELLQEDGRLACRPVFGFDYRKMALSRCGESERAFGKAQRSFSFGRRGWELELARRKSFLERPELKGIGIEAFFREVNGFAG